MRSVLALIRFSFLPNDNRGFKLTRNLPFEAKAKALFDEARLNRRFEIFERVCLPSLAAQPADRFGAILLSSDLMPDAYKERLETILSPYSNLVAAFESPRPHPLSEAFLKHLGRLGEVNELILTCRLDDDDALASDYTQKVLGYLTPVHAGYCVTFPRGFHAARIKGEPRFWESYWPLVGAGLGFIEARDSGRTIHDCGHHEKVWERLPTIVDGRSPQYLVTLHGHNDTTTARKKRSWRQRLFGRKQPHRKDQRNPPEQTYSLEQAREKFPTCAPLNVSDWSFL